MGFGPIGPIGGETDPGKGKPMAEDTRWKQTWQQLAGEAGNIGLDEQTAYDKWIAAGRPRGHDNNAWVKSTGSPTNAVTTGPGGNATVAPNADAVNEVRNAAGLGSGTGADQVATLDRGRGAVNQAIADLRMAQQGIGAAGERGRADMTASLDAAKVAGNDALEGQNDLIAQLQAQARGEGPSAALALYKLALGRNIQSQAGMAAGVRGGNAAAAARNAGIAGEGMMRESAGTAAAIRAQEQQAAQGLLGTTLAQSREGSRAQSATVADIAAQIRGQDVSTAAQGAASQAQLTGLVQSAAQLDEMKKQAAVGTALSLLQLDTQSQQFNVDTLLKKAGIQSGYQSNADQTFLGYAQLKQQKEEADRNFAAQLIGTALGGAGALGSAAITGGAAPAAGAIANKAAQPRLLGPDFYNEEQVFGNG